MLNSKQRAYLRSLGNELEPVFQIGKGGLSEEILDQLDLVLEARELIKVRVLKNCLEDEDDLADEISEALDCDVVQRIGRVFLLYRPSLENPQIVLP
ncbi:MAG TPA: ribosome assembly RNA-binding protein YhbY [Firmicutes bacterium]|jgi:RNA-binding protein|nr:MAG: RNA-binding protein [Peptococcaceae bacterium 1109]HHT73471.1 ribosome assembly RNA-binding protein YhbY [Bacillota bacterium]